MKVERYEQGGRSKSSMVLFILSGFSGEVMLSKGYGSIYQRIFKWLHLPALTLFPGILLLRGGIEIFTKWLAMEIGLQNSAKRSE